MKNLETMINELCPDGVKFITISSLCKRNKGIPITAAKMKELNKEDGSIRIFAAGNTKADVDINDIDSKSVITTPSVIVKSRGILALNITISHLAIKLKCGLTHLLMKTIYISSFCIIIYHP